MAPSGVSRPGTSCTYADRVAFPDDVLTAEEDLVFHLRPHWKAAVRPGLVLVYRGNTKQQTIGHLAGQTHGNLGKAHSDSRLCLPASHDEPVRNGFIPGAQYGNQVFHRQIAVLCCKRGRNLF